jgi:hypothetical protein
MKRYRLFAGELNGDLVLCHIGPVARDVRLSIERLFYERGDAPRRHEPEVWASARAEGWRVVPVAIEKLPDNSRRGMARNLARAMRNP